jgi:hypothetical protein
MGPFKSKAGVPYDSVFFVEQESDFYVDRLTKEWTRDRQRVGWATQQSTRTRQEPGDLLHLIAMSAYGLGAAKGFAELDAAGVHTLRVNKRWLAKYDHQWYRRLSRARFDEWVTWAESTAAVLEETSKRAEVASDLINPLTARDIIGNAWLLDSEKVSWCEEKAPGRGTPDGMRAAIALDRWFSLDPLSQQDWTPETIDLDRTREAQELLLRELMDESFSVWRSNAEVFLARGTYEWESEEQRARRRGAWEQIKDQL